MTHRQTMAVILPIMVLFACTAETKEPPLRPSAGPGLGEPLPAPVQTTEPSPVPPEIVAPLEPTTLSGPTDADYEAHVAELRARLPKKFKVFVEKPFVVIGNGNRADVRRYATGTVAWTTKRLKKAYFSRDPDEIIDIWLFADGPSYRKYSKILFGYEPDTPYGYYSESDDAMIMNISTGAGTLVHEMVHPFMAANFPDCPPWFNEGLGSLYEHSTTRNGHLWGLTNWRLVGLQRAIRRDEVPSFGKLMDQNEHQFYDEDPGTNYAQSRYLLQYLQEKKLLHDYYKRFHANRTVDPTGYQTMKDVLDVDDMDAFKTRWQRWVKKLTLKKG